MSSNGHLNVKVLVDALNAIAQQAHGVPVESMAYAMSMKAKQALHDSQYSQGVAPQPPRVKNYFVSRSGGPWLKRFFDKTHGEREQFYFYEGYTQRDAQKIIDAWNEQGKAREIGDAWEYKLTP